MFVRLSGATVEATRWVLLTMTRNDAANMIFSPKCVVCATTHASGSGFGGAFGVTVQSAPTRRLSAGDRARPVLRA